MKIILSVAFLIVTAACGTSSSSSSGTNCSQSFTCVNGACTCEEPSNKGTTCCDPKDTTCTSNKCDVFCKVCT